MSLRIKKEKENFRNKNHFQKITSELNCLFSEKNIKVNALY